MTTFQTLPLSAIVPSPHNPRKTFNQAKLDELAASIRATGVHTPVLVRPLSSQMLQDTAHMRPRPTHELVAGERRYRASLQAGVDTIPAMVRDMSDQEALEIAIVENLQRDDLNELEEAEGYQTLQQTSGMSAEEVAAKIGKSRSYVFGRLKLLDAGQETRQAMRDGLISASIGLLIARIPDTALQVKALGEVVRANHAEGVMSYRTAADWIRSRYMLKLDAAPFDIKLSTLGPGPCTGCSKRTGANPDIFSDVANADVCTDPTCYDQKVRQHRAAIRAQHEAAGHQIIDGPEAREAVPYAGFFRSDEWARLDDAKDSPTRKPLRTELAKLLDKGELKPTLIADPHNDGEFIAVIPRAEVAYLLGKCGKKKAQEEATKQQAEEDAQQSKWALERQQREFERTWRRRVLSRSAQEMAKDPSTDMPRWLAEWLICDLLERLGTPDFEQLAKDLNLGPVAPEDGVRLWALDKTNRSPIDTIMLLAAWSYDARGPWDEKETDALLLTAEDLAIDVEAIKAEVQSEMAPKPSTPLPPAAQAGGVRGEGKAQKGKAKKSPAGADAGPARLSAEEAEQGIAAAMQGLDEAAIPHADRGPQVGDHISIIGSAFARAGVITAVLSDNDVMARPDGLEGEYAFSADEYTIDHKGPDAGAEGTKEEA